MPIILCYKIFNDEAEVVEDELNNIYIDIMKNVLQKFTNFLNNKPIENLFLCNLISSLLHIPVMDFDPSICLFSALVFDTSEDAPCSIVNILKYVSINN